MKIRLYWEDFEKQMEKLNMEDNHMEFEECLLSMFKTYFSKKKIKIEWMD